MKQPGKGKSPKILITVRGVTLSAGMWMRITGIEGAVIRKAFAAGKDMDEFLFGGWVNGHYAKTSAVFDQPTKRRLSIKPEVVGIEGNVTVYEEAPRPKQVNVKGRDDSRGFAINRVENKLVNDISRNLGGRPVGIPNPRKGKLTDTPKELQRMIVKGVEVPAELQDAQPTNVRYMTREDLRNERLALMAAIMEQK